MPENEEIIGLCPEKPKGKTANEELRLKTANLVLSWEEITGLRLFVSVWQRHLLNCHIRPALRSR